VFQRGFAQNLSQNSLDAASDLEKGTPVNLTKLKDGAIRQVAFANPSAQLLEDKGSNETRIAGRPGARVVYRMRSDESEPWLFAQVFMRIDPYTVAVFQLKTEPGHNERGRAVFGAMLDSVELQDPEQLNKQRKQWIDAGQKWIDDIEPETLRESLVEERWLRILENGQDIGYIQITEQRTQTLGHTGVRIEKRQRIQQGDVVVDTVSERFESDDGDFEMWSIRTAQRRDQPKTGLPSKKQVRNQQTWAETGLREGRMLTITRDSPNDTKNVEEWNSLPEAYLSQTDLHLLPALLPRDQAATFAFYAYYTKTRKVGLRTFRVEPLDSGGYRVHDKPAPDRAAQVSTYDAHGRLVQRRMGDGRVILPTSPDRIEKVWQQRR